MDSWVEYVLSSFGSRVEKIQGGRRTSYAPTRAKMQTGFYAQRSDLLREIRLSRIAPSHAEVQSTMGYTHAVTADAVPCRSNVADETVTRDLDLRRDV